MLNPYLNIHSFRAAYAIRVHGGGGWRLSQLHRVKVQVQLTEHIIPKSCAIKRNRNSLHSTFSEPSNRCCNMTEEKALI